MGLDITGAPDTDGDGLGDLVVGASGEGLAYLFSGDPTPVADEDGPRRPDSFLLRAPHPNPFSTSTEIGVHLTQPDVVRLVVYDAIGRPVAVLADGYVEAGARSYHFDGTGLPNGVYIVRLTGASGHSSTRRMMLVR